MSFRHTFITEYIYCASEEVLDCNPKVKEVFENFAYRVDYAVREDGYGYYAGFFKTLDPYSHTQEVEKLVEDLHQVTLVPFKLTVMIESGPTLIYDITPEDPQIKKIREESEIKEKEEKLTGKIKHHIGVSVKGLEDRVLGKVPEDAGTWEVLQWDDGRFLTKEEVINEIANAKVKGWDVISACSFVDEKGRCKGHPQE